MERKIGFCVSIWASDSCLYAWTYAKQFFLRKQRDSHGNDILSPLDKLYIIHVHKEGRGKERQRWDAGGPLLSGLPVALTHYQYQLIELEGSNVHAVLLDFAAREGIDVMILGNKDYKGTVQKLVQPGGPNSTSDHIKARCKKPVLIVSPASARNEKMRIKSQVNLGALLEQSGPSPLENAFRKVSLPIQAAAGQREGVRRVVFAFETMNAASQMISWAVNYCLFPDDEVSLLHVISKSVLKGPRKSLEPADAQEDCAAMVAQDLARYNVVIDTDVKGDVKERVVELAERESFDLLVIGSPFTSRIRKALTVSLATYCLHHAPCPVLVFPYHGAHAEEVSGNLDESGELGQGDSVPAEPTTPMRRLPFGFSTSSRQRSRSLGFGTGFKSRGSRPLAVSSDDDAAATPDSAALPARRPASEGRSPGGPPKWQPGTESDDAGTPGSPQSTAHPGSHSPEGSAPHAKNGLPHSPQGADAMQRMRQQLDEKDRAIADLQEEVRRLRLALNQGQTAKEEV